MEIDLASQLPFIEDSLDSTSPEACLRLLRKLGGEWSEVQYQDTQIEPLTDGITNTLIKVARPSPGLSKLEQDQQAVLIRVYGKGTDAIIDREKELRVHTLLASKGLASSPLARFANGYIYRFTPGEPCIAQDYHDAKISGAIAGLLGRWHATLPSSIVKIDLWTNAERWLDLLPSDTAEKQQRNRALRVELAWMKERLRDTAGLSGRDLVLCHTDLLCGNVILGPVTHGTNTPDVTFIDYEYCTAAPAAFDIANLFAEWAGPDGELSWMPTCSQRMHFIHGYVRSFHDHNAVHGSGAFTTAQDDVSQLYEQVECFRGLPGLYWGIWALIQASISGIDFDYAAYAERRFGEFYDWKATEQGFPNRSVREAAWARAGKSIVLALG